MATSRRRGAVRTVTMARGGDDHGLQYAQCRSLGHEWRHIGFVTDETDPGHRRPVGMEYGSVGYRSQCDDCTTQRIKWVGRRGSRGPTRYIHPEGYERRGDDKLTTVEWRETWIVSLLGPAEPVKKQGRVRVAS